MVLMSSEGRRWFSRVPKEEYGSHEFRRKKMVFIADLLCKELHVGLGD
jgi:hypothetical protein